MCGPGRETNVDAIIDALECEKGSYLASLLERHETEIFPESDGQAFQAILAKARKVEFGPSLIVCNIVENSVGSLEAAKYVLALLDGWAH